MGLLLTFSLDRASAWNGYGGHSRKFWTAYGVHWLRRTAVINRASRVRELNSEKPYFSEIRICTIKLIKLEHSRHFWNAYNPPVSNSNTGFVFFLSSDVLFWSYGVDFWHDASPWPPLQMHWFANADFVISQFFLTLFVEIGKVKSSDFQKIYDFFKQNVFFQ